MFVSIRKIAKPSKAREREQKTHTHTPHIFASQVHMESWTNSHALWIYELRMAKSVNPHSVDSNVQIDIHSAVLANWWNHQFRMPCVQERNLYVAYSAARSMCKNCMCCFQRAIQIHINVTCERAQTVILLTILLDDFIWNEHVLCFGSGSWV